MNQEKLDLLIKRLELEASEYKELGEDFNALYQSDGDLDDAFWQGYSHGSAEFACELLQFLKGE